MLISVHRRKRAHLCESMRQILFFRFSFLFEIKMVNCDLIFLLCIKLQALKEVAICLLGHNDDGRGRGLLSDWGRERLFFGYWQNFQLLLEKIPKLGMLFPPYFYFDLILVLRILIKTWFVTVSLTRMQRSERVWSLQTQIWVTSDFLLLMHYSTSNAYWFFLVR